MAPPSWAYQVEYFIAPPDEEMICSICRCVFCEPMECQCQHVFCKNCISRWLNVHRNCPICRKRTSESQLRPVIPLLNNMIMKLNLNCHNKETGCEAVFSLEACESHLKECLYELVECSLGCGKLVFRKDVANHKLTECPFRFTKCDNCKLKVYGQWEEHDCIKALQLAAQDLEKERDKLKQELEALKTKVKELTKELDKQKSRRSDRHDSDWYRSSSCSESSGFSNPIVMLHSDTDTSDSDDTSAYIDDAADGSRSPDYMLEDDINVDVLGNDDRHGEVNDPDGGDNAGEDMSIVQSVDRILQSLTDTHRNMESILNNVGAGESSYHLDGEEDGDNNQETEQNQFGDGGQREEDEEEEEEEDKSFSAVLPESIVIDSSSSEDSDGGRAVAAASSRRYNRKRRFASPSFLSGNYDCDGGSRKTQRSSSNECSNDDADLNMMNDNVAAYAMCSTTEQEAVPSTSSGIVAGEFSRAPKGKMKKNVKSRFCSKDKKEKSSNCKVKTRGKSSATVSDAMQVKDISAQRVFEGTLSLLEQHSIDSDPEWKPPGYACCSSSSSSTSSNDSLSSSSNSCSPLDFLTSDDSTSEAAETDASYELQIPPSTYDLLTRYSACDSADESDSDYVPD